MFDLIYQVLPQALTLENIILSAIGVVIGASFAAIPGLTGMLAVCIVLPFTFYMKVIPSMALLLGIYKASMFGGSVSAISFGVPGDSPAAPDVFDGWPLCKQGKPYKALNAALYASILGNLIGDIVVIFTVVPLSIFALRFGPRELFLLMIVAMLSLTLLLGGSVNRGILAVMIGGFAATFGFDPVTSIPRLTFGLRALMNGIPLVPFIVGVFAFSEILIQFAEGVQKGRVVQKKEGPIISDFIKKRSPDDRLSFREFFSCWRELLIGGSLGVFLGALPGPGGTMAAFTSYGMASRLRKNKGKMGTGVIEGVIAPEVANSATVGPTLIPLLTFGVPGSGTAALFGAALMLQGITPGPGLFTDHMDIIVAMLILMPIGTLINLLVCKAVIIPVFSRLAMIESRLLVAWLIPIMMMGIYAINLRPYDTMVFFGAGVLGLLLRHIRVPLSPLVVAAIVVPLLEVHFRRALILSRGSLSYFVNSPIAVGLILVIFVMVVYAWRAQ